MTIKKLIFAPLLISSLLALIFLYSQVLTNHTGVFFGKWGGLYELGIIGGLIILSSLSYALYVTFTQSTKYYLFLAIPCALIPFLFLSPSLALITGIGIFAALSFSYFNILTSLKTYVNFQPSVVLTPGIKALNMLFLLTLTLVFYLNSNSAVQTQGFKMPDQIVDWAIDLSLQSANVPVKGEKYLAQLPTLTEDQLDLLKSNPQILKQYGLSPSDLDQLTPAPAQNQIQITPQLPSGNLRDLLKTQINNSLNQIIEPYLFAVPIVLAFLFYSLVSLAMWVLSMLLNPTLTLIFSILEKSGFIKFEKEMREVRKIVL